MSVPQFYEFDEQDVEYLEELKHRWTRKEKRGSGENACILIKTVSGAREQRVTNPLVSIYQDTTIRPSKLFPYQVAYVCEYQKLPRRPLLLSHICGNKKCVVPSHLVIESICENNERKICHRMLKANNILVKCTHSPNCIFNKGRNL